MLYVKLVDLLRRVTMGWIVTAKIIGITGALLICPIASAASLDIPVNRQVSVVDGDTFKIEDVRIRLWGIDAPELKQTCERHGLQFRCGEAAKTILMGILISGKLSCEVIDEDRYGRNVSRCKVDGDDVGATLVGLGWALDYPTYSKAFYRTEENAAREEKRGMWAGQFMQPWKWRKQKKVPKYNTQ